jgi:hypothetical protein
MVVLLLEESTDFLGLRLQVILREVVSKGVVLFHFEEARK